MILMRATSITRAIGRGEGLNIEILGPEMSTSEASSIWAQKVMHSHTVTVAEFIDPWLEDKVYSGIALSYCHARLHTWLEGRYDNLMPELTLSPSQGSMNSATGLEF